MGLSFPLRFIRSALGPKLRDAYPVENPELHIGAGTFNGAFHAVAGMNLVVPRLSFIAFYTGGDFQIAHQGEAWNPNNDQAHPTPARSGAGLYSYTLAATYLDEDGTPIVPSLKGARITCPQDSSSTTLAEGFAWINPGNPLQILMRVGTRVASTGVFTNADVRFWLEAH